MTLNTFKCNYQIPLYFKGLRLRPVAPSTVNSLTNLWLLLMKG